MCRGDDIDGEVQTSVIYSFLYLNNINLIHTVCLTLINY